MSNTFSDICNRIKSRFTTEASKLEGSWSADNAQAVANEIARMYAEDIDTMLDKAYVSTSYGEWLDKACSDYGITRRAATFAEVYVQITGMSGEYAAMQVAAEDIIFMTEPFTIPGSGLKSVRAVCLEVGDRGNVLAGTITKVVDRTPKIDKVINLLPGAGGFPIESDSGLRSRTLERIRMPSTSGNIADYRKWALEISGVSKVKIFPLARGKGTVDITVIAANNTVAPDILLQNIKEHVADCRPIGADVLVLAAAPVTLQIEATVIIYSGFTTADIGYQLHKRLERYCNDMAFDNNMDHNNVISYLKIADLIFDCDGIQDVSDYTINGQNKSIVLEERQFPVAVVPVITGGDT